MENDRLVFTIHPDSDCKMNQKATTRIVEGFVRERMSRAEEMSPAQRERFEVAQWWVSCNKKGPVKSVTGPREGCYECGKKGPHPHYPHLISARNPIG